MAEVALEDLADRIRPYVQGCPMDTIKQTLIDVIRDFCNFARSYQVEVDNESVLIQVSDYDIELPNTQVEPIAIEAMTVDGYEVVQRTPEWLTRFLGANWRTRSGDDFRYFTQLQPKMFCFPCVPTRNGTIGGLYYRVSLRPILTADTIDDAQSNEWLDAWSAGTLARLKAMGGTPPPRWYDPVGAGLKTKEYNSMRGAARIRVNQAYGNTELRAVGPRFA